MVAEQSVITPTEVRLTSESEYESDTDNERHVENVDDNRIKLKQKLGLVDGVAIIMGVIIGSGIFVSPKGVLESSGSVGLAIIIWVLSGLLSTVGALCYAELGTMILKSGGDYAYINEAFGPLPAFLYMWGALLIIMPTGNAITALTFSQYILQPIYPGCQPPIFSVRLIAAVITCFLTAINCYNVKVVAKVQDVFTLTKILALVVIIISGFWALFDDRFHNFEKPMENSNFEPGYIALAFYSGIFSFSGWSYLNFVTEEIKNPYKNLPRAICISVPLVIVIYVLVNIAYFIVLTKDELLSSDAVAVTFGDKVLGYFTWIIPFFVACSTFGSLNANIFTSSRLFFVGAQYGHLPKAIALIHIKKFTPIPSLIFLCILTIIPMFFEDIGALINYATFVESLFMLISVSGLLWMRYTKPNMSRPIKVNIILPITFLLSCFFIVTFPFYVEPWEVGIALLIIISGIPVFAIFVRNKNNPKWVNHLSNSFNTFCSKLFTSALAEDRY